MYTVSKEVEFDAGHRVPNHSSKCRNPHGHRYRVRATITGELVRTPGASDEGMLADFGDLKVILTRRVHDVLDHGSIAYHLDDTYLISLGEMNPPTEPGAHGTMRDWFGGEENRFGWKVIVFPYVPTAENMARWIWERIDGDIKHMGFQLQLIEVWETPTSLATYTGVID